MHISFSGCIAPYTYNCPHAHFLRNVEKRKKKVEQEVLDETSDEVEISKRMRGIELHNQAAEYIKGCSEDFPFKTETLEEARASITYAEKAFYLDTSFSTVYDDYPDIKNFVSARADVISLSKDKTGRIYDWKFANSEFGLSKHYDELEFFVAFHHVVFPDICQWDIVIHFPEENYTLPIRTYPWNKLAELQSSYQKRINTILSDKLFMPTPSKARCRFCAFRSEEAFGLGTCEYTVQ